MCYNNKQNKEKKCGTTMEPGTVDIKTEIKDYLKRVSGVMMKVIKLSEGLLSVSNGRVIFRDNIAPFPFDFDNGETVAKEQFTRIDYCLEYMSVNGIMPRYIAEIGKSLNTLYAIYDSEEKQDIKVKKSAASDLSKFVIPNDYRTDVSIPICLDEKRGSAVSWQPNEGVLSVSAVKEKSENVDSFIKSLIVRFLYSFPNANAQLMYCGRTIGDDINTFLTRMKNKVGDEFFYERTKYFGSSSDKYLSDITDVFTRLYKLCAEDRTSLLSDSTASSLLEYNMKNPNNVQSPILVILRDYPTGFENCADLEYLLNFGKKYGVFITVINSLGNLIKNSYSDETVPDPNQYADLIVNFENGKIKYKGIEFDSANIDDDKITELFDPLKQLKGKARGTVSYEDVGFGAEQLKSQEVTNEISIPVGKIEDKIYTMDFAVSSKDSKPVAYMIIGKPGCGKSSIVDSLIINGSMKYSPDDLNFYLIDFKDGVSSAPYIGNAKMPHIKLVAQKSKQEEAEIILKTVLKEKSRRNGIFIKNDCRDLVDYNKKADDIGEKHLPRIIVVIDEFQAIFKDDGDADRSQRLSDYCKQIVKEARSAGIHLLITSQNADRNMMSCVGDFISGRFCFEVVNEEHAEVVLNRENALKVKSECTGHTGVAMVSHDSGATAKKIRASYHFGKQNEYAEKVRKRWKNYKIDTVIVGDDSALNYKDIKGDKELYSDLTEGAPIGVSYYDHKTVYLPFDRSHSTLAVVGDSDGIQTDHLLSVMIYAMKRKAKILLVDESDSLMLNNIFDGYSNVEKFTGEEYLEMLSKANAELKRRIDNRRQQFEPYFVVIHSLHMIRDFTEDNRGGGAASVQGGYVSLRAVPREASNNESTVSGQTTFLQMLKDSSLVNNFYICFSIKADAFPRRGSNDVKMKIFHHAFDISMENIAERIYNHKKLGMSCNRNISLFSENQQPFEKVRFYQYGEDATALKTTVRKVIGNEN